MRPRIFGVVLFLTCLVASATSLKAAGVACPNRDGRIGGPDPAGPNKVLYTFHCDTHYPGGTDTQCTGTCVEPDETLVGGRRDLYSGTTPIDADADEKPSDGRVYVLLRSSGRFQSYYRVPETLNIHPARGGAPRAVRCDWEQS